VRCSLLALSSYIDSELDIEPSGELEAHLLACDRCQTAMGHLREESQRIGGLARLHIPDGAVHDLFSQIGLIEEGDDLPVAPPYQERPASLEAPPWFGAERGKALPWAPRGRHDPRPAGEPRELIGGRSPNAAVAEPPELFLWDEPTDQLVKSAHPTPPDHVVPDASSGAAVTPEPAATHLSEAEIEPALARPLNSETPTVAAPGNEPQPPDLGFSQPQPPQPHAGGAPPPFRRIRDALTVRLALWRGGGSHLDSGVEIVSGAGAPTWNQRAHPKPWSDSPSVVVASAPPVMDRPAPPPVALPTREPEFEGPSDDTPIPTRDEPSDDTPVAAAAATTTPELADVLGEVAMLAAPLGRTPATTHMSAVTPAPVAEPDSIEAPVMDEQPASPLAAVDDVDEPADQLAALEDDVPAEHIAAMDREKLPADQLAAVDALVAPDTFREDAPPSPVPGPGRHVRRLKLQKPDRRAWNPTQPVTGRHVLPIGGPAVAAADRDRRLWVFGAVTAVVMVLGLLIGRQVTQTAPPAANTARPTATAPAVIPPTAAPLPIATVPPVATGPPAPAPQQLTSVTKIGTGSAGFSVADVRYGMHPHDFRLVFDLAFPASVTGSPSTVIGYFGPTTIYVEFTGVDGTAPIASMPPGQVVMSVVPLPMVRNTGRLIFKITLRHNAPFNAYYLSGARLIIDVT
jgi:Putative zinc-finger